LMLTGKHLPAEEALEQGLVTQTVKAGSALDTALSLARQIQTKGPLSVAAILASVYGRKRESLQKPYQNDTQAFGALFETEDTREGIQAFLQKRLPQFKGR
ncbi:MAG: hypothetical protein GWM98_20490, partial [Nitrospinaceae bacterium]|nr:hypothetical protein [Nitrospinaceae bacterium]NIR56413.1 hypothetical protein [Nitrospinaceae bacterium]NIS86877.1 hypothetical protein [Nitrospinaceae bacterium]NIT83713.1 hypothetical protein [Nitrospinaceae bacterium]NIU45914.1 hypothetical protein [Nitrospinaceae bacterium]